MIPPFLRRDQILRALFLFCSEYRHVAAVFINDGCHIVVAYSQRSLGFAQFLPVSARKLAELYAALYPFLTDESAVKLAAFYIAVYREARAYSGGHAHAHAGADDPDGAQGVPVGGDAPAHPLRFAHFRDA